MEAIINIYPIFKYIVISFAVVGLFSFLNNAAHILGRFGKDKLDNKKDIHAKDCDTDIVQDLIQKFPLVKQEFINKNTIEQNVENNQEIHEINKRLEVIEQSLQELRKKKK
jgi:hypothetical protein